MAPDVLGDRFLDGEGSAAFGESFRPLAVKSERDLVEAGAKSGIQAIDVDAVVPEPRNERPGGRAVRELRIYGVVVPQRDTRIDRQESRLVLVRTRPRVADREQVLRRDIIVEPSHRVIV